MANSITTTQYLVNETLVRTIQYTSFAKVANRQLEEEFMNLRVAPGRTLNYRIEMKFTAGTGSTAVPQPYNVIERPLTVNQQRWTMVNFDGFELTFDRVRDKPYLDQMLIPRARTLAYSAETYIAQQLQTNLSYSVGTPGVPITFATIAYANALASQLGIPQDGQRYFALNPMDSANLAITLQNSFNKDVNTGALMDGFIGHLSGFDFFVTNFLQVQIAGAGDSGTLTTPPTGYVGAGVVTNGPITAGNEISVSGLSTTAGVTAFNAGDLISIAVSGNTYLYNPDTQQTLTAYPAQFVVTAPVVTVGTTGTANVFVEPAIVTSGPSQNISQPIPNGAQLLLMKTHNVSVAFHSSCIVFAAPALKQLRGGVETATAFSNTYKFAIVYSLGGDVVNYRQNDRMDIIFGVAINPEMGILIVS
jgi:hypothetical protein